MIGRKFSGKDGFIMIEDVIADEEANKLYIV